MNKLLNAQQIVALCETQNMITPYHRHKVRVENDIKILSKGASGAGYDLTLAADNLLVCLRGETALDPKRSDPSMFAPVEVLTDTDGARYILIPANTFVLGQVVEYINLPTTLSTIAVGKSSYARNGLIVNVTPMEPGWSGCLTIELSNTAPRPVKVYINEGILQVLFFPIDETYGYEGVYQDQQGTMLSSL